jgi:hypothetical protein
MSYDPKPGTVAYRALAYMQTLPEGTEVLTSQIAEALGMPANHLGPCLQTALTHGVIRGRQRDPHRTAPVWWSLADPRNTEPEGAAAIAGRPEKAKETTRRGAVVGVGDDAKPAVGAAAPNGLRIALWNDGELQILRDRDGLHVLLNADETRQLFGYLDVMRGDGE